MRFKLYTSNSDVPLAVDTFVQSCYYAWELLAAHVGLEPTLTVSIHDTESNITYTITAEET